jgi:hypothetical protein
MSIVDEPRRWREKENNDSDEDYYDGGEGG